MEEFKSMFEKIKTELTDRLDTAQDLNGIGVVYQKLGKTEEAFRFFKLSLEMKRKLNVDQTDIARSLGNLGAFYFESGHYEEALKCHQEALDIGLARSAWRW